MLPKAAHPFSATLRDISGAEPLMGCGKCADRETCGQLHMRNTGSLLLSCMDHCTCADPAKCDFVCPNNKKPFVQRFHEVDGWDLENIPRTRDLPLPVLPRWIPLYQGNLSGRRPTEGEPVIGLPLTMALTGTGDDVRARTDKELIRSYGAKPSEGWVLSGTQDDRAVERMWSPLLTQLARQFVESGVVFATTPNFSLVQDCPRHDNFHAMKRIAWAWFRMTEGGLCTALHLNARTDRDFERWATFVRNRPEVKAVAFEFLTGSAPKESAESYAERLIRFAEAVGRPIPLVMRGFASMKSRLEQAFSQVVLLDSTPYMRATKRRKAYVKANGSIGHIYTPTSTPRETRRLLLHNVDVHRAHALAPFGPPIVDVGPVQGLRDLRQRPSQVDADHKSSQMRLFPDDGLGL